MSPLGFSLLFLVSFFFASERCLPEVPFLRAILQIYLRHIIVAETCYSLPPQHLLSSHSSTWIWIWLLAAEFSPYITTTSPRCLLLSRRTLPLLQSSESPACSGKRYHTQGTSLTYSYLLESEEAQAEEEPLLFCGECCICQEEDTSNNLETPCDYNDNLKYAHRICAQHWSNEKDNRTCGGICCQPYQSGFIALSSLTASLNNIVWPSCSAILAKLVQRVSSRVAHHPYLHLFKVASLVFKSSLSKPKISRFGLSDTYLGLQSYIFFSFKERASSQWERSIIPPSSGTERTFPSSLYSSVEETFGV